MASAKVDITKEDLYGILNVEATATEKEVFSSGMSYIFAMITLLNGWCTIKAVRLYENVNPYKTKK